jgi:hypothetical protein
MGRREAGNEAGGKDQGRIATEGQTPQLLQALLHGKQIAFLAAQYKSSNFTLSGRRPAYKMLVL